MRLKFTKMHGAGNDFVVIDGVTQRVALSTAQLRHLGDRRFGIGCDQILLAERAAGAAADFRYRTFNADGGEVELSGNGARCFARFVRNQGLTDKDQILVETLAGPISMRLLADDRVSVQLRVPRFEPEQIPFIAEQRALDYDLEVGGEHVRIMALSVGNPHAVQRVADVDAAPVTTQGPRLERHERFPNRVNVGYLQILDRSHVRLRVWERGAGETLACGSGATAAVVAGRQHGWLDDRVAVSLPGGTLEVSWAGEGEPVWLAGPATTVYEGTIDLGAP